MYKSISFAVAVCVFCLFGVGSSAFAGIYDELTPAQKKLVQNGKQVFVMVDVQDKPWPKGYVYQRIDSTTEEAAAVFSDYERQKEYVPNVMKAKIKKRINRSTMLVDYKIKIPWPMKNENYTVNDRVSAYDKGSSYSVDWSLVRADTTKHIEGYAKFEKLGTGTIMAYYNFIVPGQRMAKMVKEKAMKQVKDTAQAFVTRIEWERKNAQDLLQRQIQALRKAVGN